MKNLLRSAKAVLIAYFTAELIRSKGLIHGLLSLAVWLSVFVLPASLFIESEDVGTVAAGMFVGVAVFLAYSTATWDWAMLLRWLLQLGVLEYVLASGSPLISHYLGTIPVSITWYVIALGLAYGIIRTFVGPPNFNLVDIPALLVGVFMLLLVLLAYSFLLGGSVLATGSAGPIVELVSWLLPIATGGIFPVTAMPEPLRVIAYLTPFSYPSELLRYSLGVSYPALNPEFVSAVGMVYSIAFMILSAIFLRYQVGKALKEGVKTVALF